MMIFVAVFELNACEMFEVKKMGALIILYIVHHSLQMGTFAPLFFSLLKYAETYPCWERMCLNQKILPDI